MEIKVGKSKYRLTSDNRLNFILQERVKVKPRDGGEPRYEYKDVGYFSRLEHVVERLLNMSLMRCDAKTVEELWLELLSVNNELMEFVNQSVKVVPPRIESVAKYINSGAMDRKTMLEVRKLIKGEK